MVGERLAATLLLATTLAGCASSGKPLATTPSKPSTTTRATTTTSATPPVFVATPRRVAIGQRVTFSGANCPPDEEVLVIISYDPGSSARAKPRADGSWSVTTAINDDAATGTVPVFAMCQSRTQYLNFKPTSLQILTYRRLIVTPDTGVRAGSTLTLTATGGCNRNGDVVVDLVTASDQLAHATLDRKVASRFRGKLRIPPGTPPGTYSLTTVCMAFRTYYAHWPPTQIKVT